MSLEHRPLPSIHSVQICRVPPQTDIPTYPHTQAAKRDETHRPDCDSTRRVGGSDSEHVPVGGLAWWHTLVALRDTVHQPICHTRPSFSRHVLQRNRPTEGVRRERDVDVDVAGGISRGNHGQASGRKEGRPRVQERD